MGRHFNFFTYPFFILRENVAENKTKISRENMTVTEEKRNFKK